MNMPRHIAEKPALVLSEGFGPTEHRERSRVTVGVLHAELRVDSNNVLLFRGAPVALRKRFVFKVDFVVQHHCPDRRHDEG